MDDKGEWSNFRLGESSTTSREDSLRPMKHGVALVGAAVCRCQRDCVLAIPGVCVSSARNKKSNGPVAVSKGYGEMKSRATLAFSHLDVGPVSWQNLDGDLVSRIGGPMICGAALIVRSRLGASFGHRLVTASHPPPGRFHTLFGLRGAAKCLHQYGAYSKQRSP